ncbi:hypothetical protein BLOT_011275 [Blomia tropicalis]|nr:hypothetical protein BLOT_011275 [Blomia tropicalis]
MDKQIVAQIRENISKLKKPNVQLILSGKRKCGKDYVEQLIMERYGDLMKSFRISAPIKKAFADQHSLDYEMLLSASKYKETYRQQMVEWSDSIRSIDANYFLRMTIDQCFTHSTQSYPIWLLNDARRISDLNYFHDKSEIDIDHKNIITIRIVADPMVRMERGYQFTEGIDDQITECGLDSYQQWDHIIHNNGTKDDLLKCLQPIFNAIDTKIGVN